jgi:uncharacterized damage-inducible protein DinB
MIAQMFLPELDHEMGTTRRVLERVPDGNMEWRPHPKSMTLGRLASHIAELPSFAERILRHESFNIAPPQGDSTYTPRSLATRQEILDLFDSNVAAGRELIAATDDATFGQTWSLMRGDHPVFTLPRAAVVRSMLFSHVIHHRGQLTVYLRLNDVPLPSVYGPSADEAA